MTKIKWGRLLAGLLLLGAAIAVGIAYFKKYKDDSESLDDEFDDFEDDFDDFDDDLEDDGVTVKAATREYVSIPKEKETAAAEAEEKTTEETAADSEEE